MKVDFDAVIMKLDGEPFKVNDGAPKPGPDGQPAEAVKVKSMTLNWVAVEALLWFNSQQPSTDSGEVKARCAHLAMRIYQGGVQELSVEDLVVLKEKIGANIAHPLVVGTAFSLLEQRRIGEA